MASKLLITVRRNDLRFKHLTELGVDVVEWKDGIQIRLAEFDLAMHWRRALSEYASLHEIHCTEFARTVLERAERESFLDQPGPTRREFVEYLETGVDRDFKELF